MKNNYEKRIYSLLKNVLLNLEESITKDVKIVDLKNHVYILEKVLSITKKHQLGDKRLKQIDNDIIEDFINRYLDKKKSVNCSRDEDKQKSAQDNEDNQHSSKDNSDNEDNSMA